MHYLESNTKYDTKLKTSRSLQLMFHLLWFLAIKVLLNGNCVGAFYYFILQKHRYNKINFNFTTTV